MMPGTVMPCRKRQKINCVSEPEVAASRVGRLTPRSAKTMTRLRGRRSAKAPKTGASHGDAECGGGHGHAYGGL